MIPRKLFIPQEGVCSKLITAAQNVLYLNQWTNIYINIYTQSAKTGYMGVLLVGLVPANYPHLQKNIFYQMIKIHEFLKMRLKSVINV